MLNGENPAKKMKLGENSSLESSAPSNASGASAVANAAEASAAPTREEIQENFQRDIETFKRNLMEISQSPSVLSDENMRDSVMSTLQVGPTLKLLNKISEEMEFNVTMGSAKRSSSQLKTIATRVERFSSIVRCYGTDAELKKLMGATDALFKKMKLDAYKLELSNYK